MANVFLNVSIPGTPGAGFTTDVSFMGPRKTITIPPFNNGKLVVEVAGLNSSNFVPLFVVDGPAGEAQVSIFDVACGKMRVRRLAGSDITRIMNVAAGPGTPNEVVLPVGGTAEDVSDMGEEKTVLVSGDFEGQVVISGSADGTSFNPVQTINVIGAGAYSFRAIYQFMKVERLIILKGSVTSVIVFEQPLPTGSQVMRVVSTVQNGLAAPGPISFPTALVGDVVITAMTLSDGVFASIISDFEPVITVADEIQQTLNTDLSGASIYFLVQTQL